VVVARHLRGTAAALVVVGHTHMQYDRQEDAWRLVNAGSVGMPYEPPRRLGCSSAGAVAGARDGAIRGAWTSSGGRRP
jgi:predicted phosphodiesterase